MELSDFEYSWNDLHDLTPGATSPHEDSTRIDDWPELGPDARGHVPDPTQNLRGNNQAGSHLPELEARSIWRAQRIVQQPTYSQPFRGRSSSQERQVVFSSQATSNGYGNVTDLPDGAEPPRSDYPFSGSDKYLSNFQDSSHFGVFQKYRETMPPPTEPNVYGHRHVLPVDNKIPRMAEDTRRSQLAEAIGGAYVLDSVTFFPGNEPRDMPDLQGQSQNGHPRTPYHYQTPTSQISSHTVQDDTLDIWSQDQDHFPEISLDQRSPIHQGSVYRTQSMGAFDDPRGYSRGDRMDMAYGQDIDARSEIRPQVSPYQCMARVSDTSRSSLAASTVFGPDLQGLRPSADRLSPVWRPRMATDSVSAMEEMQGSLNTTRKPCIRQGSSSATPDESPFFSDLDEHTCTPPYQNIASKGSQPTPRGTKRKRSSSQGPPSNKPLRRRITSATRHKRKFTDKEREEIKWKRENGVCDECRKAKRKVRAAPLRVVKSMCLFPVNSAATCALPMRHRLVLSLSLVLQLIPPPAKKESTPMTTTYHQPRTGCTSKYAWG